GKPERRELRRVADEDSHVFAALEELSSQCLADEARRSCDENLPAQVIALHHACRDGPSLVPRGSGHTSFGPGWHVLCMAGTAPNGRFAYASFGSQEAGARRCR